MRAVFGQHAILPMRRLIYILIGFILLLACRKDVIENITPFEFNAPAYFPAVHYSFSNNEVTKERFELGKRLFFDGILSSDNTISCASCHAQVHAFADHNVALSSGVEGRLGNRNSPSIANLAWSPSFMWDGGVNHIEIFSVAPITDSTEMNETMQNVIDKLNADVSYVFQFNQAYGVEEVNDQAMLRALTIYMMMIVSDQSKYDRWIRGEALLTDQESQGKILFEQKCSSCHSGSLQTDYTFRNNGLDEMFTDLGRGRITQNETDYGRFKVPSLRNVMLTYPYMHDGRFFSIRDVLNHYDSGIVHSETLDPLLIDGIPMTESEKDAIIAFLSTLTDYKLLNAHWLNK